MSRQIDLEKPLSDDDRAYLEARNDFRSIAIADANAEKRDPDPAETDPGLLRAVRAIPHPQDQSPETTGAAVVQRQRGGDVPPVVPPAQSPLATLADENAQVAGTGEVPEEDASDPEQALADNYDNEDAWSYRDLQDEAKGRSLAATGSREDLIARLREDDSKES